MATKSISQLDTQATANETDLFEVAIVDQNSASGYASKKESAAAIADAIVGEYQYPLRLTETTSKTISGAINEIAGEVAGIKDLEGSASGNIATFVDGSANPLKELEISIEAVQSGSGDPSPTNVRPITGWTGATINVSGEDTSNPTTYNIDWQSTAGTVYSGTINPLTGVLTVTHAYENMSNAELYVSNESYKIVRKKGLPSAANVVGGKNAKCNITNLFGNVSTSSYDNTKLQFSTNPNSYFYMSMPIDFDPGDVYFCYELATPITYQLTPTEVRSLLGQNNIWADCGEITELKYTRDLNLCLQDIIARIEALEGGSSNRSLSLSPTLTKSLTSDSDKTEGILEEETEEETKEEAQKNER